ncbi:MAG: biotin/lipoyl-binding protein [Planctomycetes bacterium]|nr:biotin/lipoyl-binding protein [Planctomycetota bacterium]
MKYFVEINGRPHEVELTERLGVLSVKVDGEPLDLAYSEVDGLGQFFVLSEGRSYAVSIDGEASELGVTIAGALYDVHIEDERERAAGAAERAAAKQGGLVKSVMPGVVVEICVEVGQEVEAGQPLLILEAMKMQNELVAPHGGRIQSIHAQAGQAVAMGAKLIQIASLEAPE